MNISVIIPAYQEHKTIAQMLKQFENHLSSTQILVVDQSENSLTYDEVKKCENIHYVRSKGNSRASTMNHGAQEALGDILLFLHADCILPTGWEGKLAEINTDKYQRGGFIRKHTPEIIQTRIADAVGGLLARRWGYLLGDNAIRVKKDLFFDSGIYRDESLFEDVHLAERLRKSSPWWMIPDLVLASSRKFIASGARKAFWLMLGMQILYQGGMSIDRLARLYKKLRN